MNKKTQWKRRDEKNSWLFIREKAESFFLLHLFNIKNRIAIIWSSLKKRDLSKHVMNMRKGWFVVIKIFAPDFMERMFRCFYSSNTKKLQHKNVKIIKKSSLIYYRWSLMEIKWTNRNWKALILLGENAGKMKKENESLAEMLKIHQVWFGMCKFIHYVLYNYQIYHFPCSYLATRKRTNYFNCFLLRSAFFPPRCIAINYAFMCRI